MIVTVDVDLKRIVEKTQRKLETVVQEFTNDMGEEVVKATPVDTGFLRGSWFPSINDDKAVFDGHEDKGGAVTVSRLSLAAARSKIGDVIYILNGARYARYVEYGTSRMAPRAFVRGTVSKAPQIAKQTIRRIARR